MLVFRKILHMYLMDDPLLPYFFFLKVQWKNSDYELKIKFSICLSETYLNSSIPPDDDNLELPRYSLVHTDNPANTKIGGACIYYLNSLPLKVIDI